ncbi:membrane protease subunit (stomatin/prohibitin family) [Breznakia sp. PF5-3]|uniref:SPFH domain-containing protein n=1 Tax=unclassified Breznakia TaxID=2623764 RepID=UPI002405DF91|nr:MULTISPECIES: SPFH domain-containing protein [unclassified Breznakia]MDF9824030.1 membrane protease subunit (stomatin/prohibitin family) [Breznakia sp. PM6-1]MDF9834829.1 membrane protease subunit (stomatin/prohibitin family) [Breznakia sp. PF5-3]MDF9838148.1 membrane protease subunit (stomatin/prohibitin family) [Breznakia sp. PFB2-8]MDF9860134.1 membrane protease subunit (stomatin/prohibitin family) [Breznakia sp. PH5-24]
MGLIRAAVASARTTLADQWVEYFYCDSLSNDELLKKGEKTVSSGSNTKGSPNIITDGTGIAVNEGQGVLIVEDGKVVEFTMEPGRFTWNSSSEPSLFSGGFQGLKDSFKTFGKRFTMGGTPGKDQRVYFINLKEIFDNKFGTSTPMPYKDPTYRGIYIRYFGQYTIKIEDPIRFYTNVSGNVERVYLKSDLMQQGHAEFVNALDVAIAKCSDENYQYNDLPKKQIEIAKFMNDALDDDWKERRGVVISSVAIEKVTPDDESRARIEKIDDAIMMSDQRVAAGRLAEAQANAMEKAAENDAGAMQGFLGMGFAAQAGGMNTGNMFEGTNQQENSPFFENNPQHTASDAEPFIEPAQAPSNEWKCKKCGHMNSGKFCSECGDAKPDDGKWTCECGHENTGKFCGDCGKKKPE